jgi:hypothetical protein
MRRETATLFRLFLIMLAAAWSGSALLAADCPETKPATHRGPIAPNGPWIAYQCPEACGNKTPGTFVRHTEDPYLLDWIFVWCSGGYEVGIPANTSCWNCINGCAGSNCPPGELCVPIKNSWGSDCQRYACDDPAYTLVENWTTGIPYCRRSQPCPTDPPVQQCTPATVMLEGPTKIRPGATCTWSAQAFSECSGATYTYTWYVANQYAGTGEYYTGGRPSGVQIGYPWKIRVEATYNGYAAGSQEITVKEDSTARICVN